MNWKRTSLATVIPLLLVSACTSPVVETGDGQEGDTPPSLAESSWELAEISAGDGEEAKSETVEEGLYTLLFRADGTAAMRFDCNRGFGRWQAGERDGASKGSISFSEIGVTKALCPPESISDRVIADFSAFDGVLVEEDRLVLTIDREGVSYVWSRAAEGAADGGNK